MRATLLDYRASSPRALRCLRRKKCCRTAGCEANAAALNNRSVVVALFICRYLVYFELYGLLRSDDAAGILQRSVSGQGAMDCRGGATSSNVVAFRIASLNHPETSRRRRPRAARAGKLPRGPRFRQVLPPRAEHFHPQMHLLSTMSQKDRAS